MNNDILPVKNTPNGLNDNTKLSVGTATTPNLNPVVAQAPTNTPKIVEPTVSVGIDPKTFKVKISAPDYYLNSDHFKTNVLPLFEQIGRGNIADPQTINLLSDENKALLKEDFDEFRKQYETLADYQILNKKGTVQDYNLEASLSKLNRTSSSDLIAPAGYTMKNGVIVPIGKQLPASEWYKQLSEASDVDRAALVASIQQLINSSSDPTYRASLRGLLGFMVNNDLLKAKDFGTKVGVFGLEAADRLKDSLLSKGVYSGVNALMGNKEQISPEDFYQSPLGQLEGTGTAALLGTGTGLIAGLGGDIAATAATLGTATPLLASRIPAVGRGLERTTTALDALQKRNAAGFIAANTARETPFNLTFGVLQTMAQDDYDTAENFIIDTAVTAAIFGGIKGAPKVIQAAGRNKGVQKLNEKVGRTINNVALWAGEVPVIGSGGRRLGEAIVDRAASTTRAVRDALKNGVIEFDELKGFINRISEHETGNIGKATSVKTTSPERKVAVTAKQDLYNTLDNVIESSSVKKFKNAVPNYIGFRNILEFVDNIPDYAKSKGFTKADVENMRSAVSRFESEVGTAGLTSLDNFYNALADLSRSYVDKGLQEFSGALSPVDIEGLRRYGINYIRLQRDVSDLAGEVRRVSNNPKNLLQGRTKSDRNFIDPIVAADSFLDNLAAQATNVQNATIIEELVQRGWKGAETLIEPDDVLRLKESLYIKKLMKESIEAGLAKYGDEELEPLFNAFNEIANIVDDPNQIAEAIGKLYSSTTDGLVETILNKMKEDFPNIPELRDMDEISQRIVAADMLNSREGRGLIYADLEKRLKFKIGEEERAHLWNAIADSAEKYQLGLKMNGVSKAEDVAEDIATDANAIPEDSASNTFKVYRVDTKGRQPNVESLFEWGPNRDTGGLGTGLYFNIKEQPVREGTSGAVQTSFTNTMENPFVINTIDRNSAFNKFSASLMAAIGRPHLLTELPNLAKQAGIKYDASLVDEVLKLKAAQLDGRVAGVSDATLKDVDQPINDYMKKLGYDGVLNYGDDSARGGSVIFRGTPAYDKAMAEVGEDVRYAADTPNIPGEATDAWKVSRDEGIETNERYLRVIKSNILRGVYKTRRSYQGMNDKMIKGYEDNIRILKESGPNRVILVGDNGNAIDHPATEILEAFSRETGEDLPPIIVGNYDDVRSRVRYQGKGTYGTYHERTLTMNYSPKEKGGYASVYHETVHHIDNFVQSYTGNNTKMLELKKLREAITREEVRRFMSRNPNIKNANEYVAHNMDALLVGRMKAENLGPGVLRYLKKFFESLKEAVSLYGRKYRDAKKIEGLEPVDYIKELDKAIHEVDSAINKLPPSEAVPPVSSGEGATTPPETPAPTLPPETPAPITETTPPKTTPPTYTESQQFLEAENYLSNLNEEIVDLRANISTPYRDKHVVKYQKNGQTGYMRVNDPMLANYFNSSRPVGSDNLLVRTASMFSRTLRLAQTTLSPAFVPVSLARDALQSLVMVGSETPTLTATGRAIAKEASPEEAQKIMAAIDEATRYGSFFDIGAIPSASLRYSQRITNEANIVDKLGEPGAWLTDPAYKYTQYANPESMAAIRNVFKKPQLGDGLKGLSPFSMNGLEATFAIPELYIRRRVGAEAALQAIKSGATHLQAMDAAIFAAQNATANFRRVGRLVSQAKVDKFTPYFNAMIQGQASFYRMFSLDPVGISMRAFTSFALPAMALAAWNMTDNKRAAQYQNIPEYIKQDYWIITTDGSASYISIPIPQELRGFNTALRESMEAWHNIDPQNFAEIAGKTLLDAGPFAMSDALAPGPDGTVSWGNAAETIGREMAGAVVPQLGRAILNQATGVNTFTGNPLQPDDLEIQGTGPNGEVLPSDRVFAGQDSMTLGAVANLIGKIPGFQGIGQGNLSRLMSDLFGNNVLTAVNALDTLLGAPEERRGGKSLAETMAKRFFMQPANASETAFYRGLDELEDKKEALEAKLRASEKKSAFLTGEEANAQNALRQQLIKDFGSDINNFINNYQGYWTRVGGLKDWQKSKLINLFKFDDNLGASELGSAEDQARQQLSIAEKTNAEGRALEAGLSPDMFDNYRMTYNPDTGTIDVGGSVYTRQLANSFYGVPKEAVADLKSIVDDSQEFGVPSLREVYNDYRERINKIYDKKQLTSADYDKIEALQNKYMKEFDARIEPFLQQYGGLVFNNNDVVNAVRTLVMIPRSDWAESKTRKGYGKYISSSAFPNAGADVKKVLLNRYGVGAVDKSNLPSDAEVTYAIKQIDTALDSGREASATSRARTMLQRINAGQIYANHKDLQYLTSVVIGD